MGMVLEGELRDLKERFGVSPADLTADELERLVLAARRVGSPFSCVNAALAERPFAICRGVYGWPMTAGAIIWLSEFAKRWWPGGGMMFKWAQVYAMIHAREADAFASLTDKGSARVAIMKTALRLACHRREVQHALLRSYNAGEDQTDRPEDPDAERAQTDFASLIARLEVETGVPSDTWLWGKSLWQMLRCYEEMHAFAAAFAAGEGSRRKMVDELDEAVNDLARLKLEIMRNHARGRAK